MLGISQPGRNQNRAFTWESASNILCILRKTDLSTRHTAINYELAERLSQVNTVVIYSGEGENTNHRDGEPGRFEGEVKRDGGERRPGRIRRSLTAAPTCSVPGLSQQSASSRSAAFERSKPGLPATRSAAPVRHSAASLHLGGVTQLHGANPGSTGGLT